MRPLSCNVGKNPLGTPEACFLKIVLLANEHVSVPGRSCENATPQEHTLHTNCLPESQVPDMTQ